MGAALTRQIRDQFGLALGQLLEAGALIVDLTVAGLFVGPQRGQAALQLGQFGLGGVGVGAQTTGAHRLVAVFGLDARQFALGRLPAHRRGGADETRQQGQR